MSQSSQPRPISYSEVVRIFTDQDVQDDLNDASRKLAYAMSAMMVKFDAVAKQMHSIDLLRLCNPLKPRWDSLRKDLGDLVWQFRTNAGVISGRIKLFHTSVLPMLVARNLDENYRRSPSCAESLQVLQSYMTISAEHAALTGTLMDRAFKFSAHLAAFSSDFTKLASRHALSGQKEMCDLSQRLSELDNHIQHLFSTSGEASSAGPALILFTSSRMVSSSGRASGRSKITRRQIVLDGDLAAVGNAYEHVDRKRSEVAHAQYSAQLRQSRTDLLASTHTMICALLLDELLTSESGLSLFFSIWSRLRCDCSEIFHWLKNSNPSTTPMVILCCAENRSSLYATLSGALDEYAAGVDPSLSPSETRESR